MLYFSRAWVNVGKSVRLCQMLGLQRLDVEGSDVKRILSPPRDWIELEERRRTFWAAYYCDRWASAGTGWPMVIEEKDVSYISLLSCCGSGTCSSSSQTTSQMLRKRLAS